MLITGRWQQRDTTTVTQVAPGAGRYNILKSLMVIGNSGCTISVQSPSGTTLWSTELGAGGGGFTLNWDGEGGVFGAENQALLIVVSTGSYTISANGVIVG